MGVRAIFLVGFMGSGKSSVGQELARRLRWDFLDLDARIEARERRTIPEIFRDHGEPGFRLVETAALCELTESLERDTVVALGGGAFAQEKNRALILHWPTVFLEAPDPVFWTAAGYAVVQADVRGSLVSIDVPPSSPIGDSFIAWRTRSAS